MLYAFQLQKKLDSYHRRLREVETNGIVARGRGSAFRDVGANLRDFSGGVVGNIKGGLSGLQQVRLLIKSSLLFYIYFITR